MSKDEDFADLEIRILQCQEGNGYPVEFTFNSEQVFERAYLAEDFVTSWVGNASASEDGEQIFAWLLADERARNAWAETRGQSAQRRIRLRIDPLAPELHRLPWESLSDNQKLMAADAGTPFSRYLPVALPWGDTIQERPIRILAVISNPSDLKEKYDLAEVDIEAESDLLRTALSELSADDLQLDFLEGPITLEKLEESLRSGYHVLNFVGHGAFSPTRQQAALYLQDDDGTTKVVTEDQIIGMLAHLQQRPRLIYLSACQSATRSTADSFIGLGPKLVSVGVPAVVAMQDYVAIETARKMSGVFFTRLASHGLVDLALNEARGTLITAGKTDVAVPVLFMRLKSGRLWGTEVDNRGEILGGGNPRIFWSGLVRMIQNQKCIPIIGPRVHGRWLPNHHEIAKRWSEIHEYPFSDQKDLARVAQYMASNSGEDFPRAEFLDTIMEEMQRRLPPDMQPDRNVRTLTDLVRNAGWESLAADNPNNVHTVLADLNLPIYLNTNCDSFMVEALQAKGRKATREVCRWHENLDGLPSRFEDDEAYQPSTEEPLVYHLFGSDEEIDSLVLSEDNYLDFLVRTSAERDRIPNYIRGSLANASLMFVGFSLYDWSFRAIMRGLVATLDRRRRFKHVAVQLEFEKAAGADTAAVQTFLQQYFQDADINVFWGSTQQYIAELREQWEAA